MWGIPAFNYSVELTLSCRSPLLGIILIVMPPEHLISASTLEMDFLTTAGVGRGQDNGTVHNWRHELQQQQFSRMQTVWMYKTFYQLCCVVVKYVLLFRRTENI
jgi:hypothetical protein